MASEIDLPWTYVGGPRGLIDAILADDRIEALPAAPDDRVSRVEDWVAAWIDQLFEGLLAHGTASLSTPRGTVDARLRRPHGTRNGDLRVEITRLDGGSGSSWASLTGARRGSERRAQLPDIGRAEPHREVTLPRHGAANICGGPRCRGHEFVTVDCEGDLRQEY